MLYGQGIGRYDAAQLPDATVNAAGDVVPLTGYSIMAGLTSHNAIKDLDLYAYAGENHVFNHVTFTAAGTPVGFGDGTVDNSNCFASTPLNPTGITNSTTGCAKQINNVWQVTGGFWHSVYDGKLGKVVWGVQDSFTVDSTPTPSTNNELKLATCANGHTGLCGAKEDQSMNVVMMSFRYYPKYGDSGWNPAVTRSA